MDEWARQSEIDVAMRFQKSEYWLDRLALGVLLNKALCYVVKLRTIVSIEFQ